MNLDLNDAAIAPPLSEAPVPRALLAAAISFDAGDPANETVGTGRVHLLTPDGQWRRIEYTDFGYHIESAFELSPDGRRLAMSEGDKSAVIVVNLHDSSFTRYPLPVREAIVLRWAPDSSAIKFFGRDKMGPGFELDLSTSRVRKTRYEAYFSDYAGGPRKSLEVSRNDDGYGVINTFTDGRHRSSQLLQYSDILGLDPKMRRFLAYDYRTRRRDRDEGANDGITVVDPATGELHAMLTDERVRRTWTQSLDWITDRELAFVSARPGLVKTWNVDNGRIHLLASFVQRGVSVSLAREPAAELIEGERN